MQATITEHAKVSFARRYNLSRYFRHAALIAWALFVIFPIFWMISTSFKDKHEWVSWPPHWVAHDPTLHNYRQIFAITASGFDESLSRDPAEQAFNIWKSVGDSILIATASALISLLLGTFMAYATSRFNVGGKNFRHIINRHCFVR